MSEERTSGSAPAAAIRRYAELVLQKQQLDDSLKTVESLIDKARERAQEQLELMGVQKVTLKDLKPAEHAVCLSRRVWLHIIGTVNRALENLPEDSEDVEAAEALQLRIKALEEAYSGERTVYMASTIRASVRKVSDDGVDVEQRSIDALRGNDMFSFLISEKVNANSLSAVVRELDRDDAGNPILPDDVKDAIGIFIDDKAKVIR